MGVLFLRRYDCNGFFCNCNIMFELKPYNNKLHRNWNVAQSTHRTLSAVYIQARRALICLISQEFVIFYSPLCRLQCLIINNNTAFISAPYISPLQSKTSTHN